MEGSKVRIAFSKAVVVSTGNTPSTQEAAQPEKPKLSFLDLPFEIRETIYSNLGLPDLLGYYNCWSRGPSQNAVGCTNILMSNRQIYAETITYFRKMPNTVHLSGSGRMVFRDPLATGKPGFFHSHAAGSRTFVPDCLSELEFINLQIVTIKIKEQSSHSDVVEILEAIKKSHTLKHIHLKCQVSRATQNGREEPQITTDWTTVNELKNSIRPLITYCINYRIKLTASSNDWFENNSGSARANRQVHAPKHIDPLTSHIDDFHPLQISNDTIDEAAKHSGTIGVFTDFKLTPECNLCHALFLHPHHLHTHHKHHPTHNIPFRARQYNLIHARAKPGGNCHVCLVCARSYDERDALKAHINKARHQRNPTTQGVVGRWVEDNDSFTCLETAGGSGGELHDGPEDKHRDWLGDAYDDGWGKGHDATCEDTDNSWWGNGYGHGAW